MRVLAVIDLNVFPRELLIRSDPPVLSQKVVKNHLEKKDFSTKAAEIG